MTILGDSSLRRRTYLLMACAVLPLLVLVSYQQQVDNTLSTRLNRTLQAYNLSVTATGGYRLFLTGVASASVSGQPMLDAQTLSALDDVEATVKSLNAVVDAASIKGLSNAARALDGAAQTITSAIDRIKVATQSVSPADFFSTERSELDAVKNSLDGMTGAYLQTVSELLNAQQNRQSSQRYMLALVTVATLLLLIMIARHGMRRSAAIDEMLVATREADSAAFTPSESTRHVGAELAELKHAVQEINLDLASAVGAGTQQVVQGNKELAELANKQTQQLAAIMQQLQALSRANERNVAHSKKANELARGAALMAGQGGQMVEETAHTLVSLREEMEQAINIISFIDSFTSQSHLLVLNATMEAARAGEIGAGFVATSSELGNLAQRSAAAIKQLREVLDQSINNIGFSVEALKATGSARRDLANAVSRVIVATAATDTSSDSPASASAVHRELSSRSIVSSNQAADETSAATNTGMGKIKLYRHRRLNVLWQAKLWSGDSFVGEGVVRNLSATGAFIETNLSLESGIRYLLAIHNAAVEGGASETEVVLEGEIMRVSGSIGMSRSYGMHFLRIRRQDKVVLRQQVASLFIQQNHGETTDHDLQDSLETVDRLAVIGDEELGALGAQQNSEAVAATMRAANVPH